MSEGDNVAMRFSVSSQLDSYLVLSRLRGAFWIGGAVFCGVDVAQVLSFLSILSQLTQWW